LSLLSKHEEEHHAQDEQIVQNNKDSNSRSSSSDNPMTLFAYALKSPETKRQYPRRFKVFLDFLNLGTDVLEEQAKIFLKRARKDPLL
jgi:hypothetical protein